MAGRVLARREMGKLVFLDVVDRTGRIQVICETAKTGEIDVLLGDVVGVSGHAGRARRLALEQGRSGAPSALADRMRQVLHELRNPAGAIQQLSNTLAAAIVQQSPDKFEG